MPEQSHLAEPALLLRSSRCLAQLLLDFTKVSCTFLPSYTLTCVSQESFNFLKAGATSAAAGTRVRREGDSEKEEVVPPDTYLFFSDLSYQLRPELVIGKPENQGGKG